MSLTKSHKKLFGWRAPAASDGELRAKVELYESCGVWGGIAVIFGVAAEFGLAIWNPPAGSFAGRWGLAIASLIVALGVAAEVLFGKMASRRQGELLRRSEERLAIALERTEQRTLKDGKLIVALKKYPHASLVMKYLNDDPESQAFAKDFELVFSSNGWKVSWYTESYGDDLVPGIRLPSRNPEDAVVIESVRAALAEAGIEFSTDPVPVSFMSTGPYGVQAAGPLAILYIGPKPPIPRE